MNECCAGDPVLIAMLVVTGVCAAVWAAIREWQLKQLRRSYEVVNRTLGVWQRIATTRNPGVRHHHYPRAVGRSPVLPPNRPAGFDLPVRNHR